VGRQFVGGGLLAAPTLFATLSDRVLAGTIAASLFKNQAWLSIACALVMLVLLWATKLAPAASLPVRRPIWRPRRAVPC
jgi:hypothetical protein